MTSAVKATTADPPLLLQEQDITHGPGGHFKHTTTEWVHHCRPQDPTETTIIKVASTHHQSPLADHNTSLAAAVGLLLHGQTVSGAVAYCYYYITEL